MSKPHIPTARDIMVTRIHTIPADADVVAAIRALLKHGHSGAPVVDGDGAVVGVLSEHDCIRLLAQAIAGGWPQGNAGSHATREVDTVSPTEDLLALATRFSEGRHRRLLVIEDDRLVGLVCRRDLLRALEKLEKEAEPSRKQSTYEAIGERRRRLD